MSLPEVGFRPDTPTALSIIDCAIWPYTVQAGTTQAKFKVDAHSAILKELQPMSIGQGDTIQVTASKRTDGSVAFAVEIIARYEPDDRDSEEFAEYAWNKLVLLHRRCMNSAITNCKANNIEPTPEMISYLTGGLMQQAMQHVKFTRLVTDSDELPF